MDETRPRLGPTWRAARRRQLGETLLERLAAFGRIRKGLGAFAIAVDSTHVPAVGQTHVHAAGTPNYRPEGATVGNPRAKIQRVSDEAGGIQRIHALTGTGAQLKILRCPGARLRLS